MNSIFVSLNEKFIWELVKYCDLPSIELQSIFISFQVYTFASFTSAFEFALFDHLCEFDLQLLIL